MHTRIIPRLDIKGPNLVKGIHLEGLRVLGKPEEFASFYYKSLADELLYMDTVATLYGRNSLFQIVRETKKEIFIPLMVGGGLRTIDDMQTALRWGADKVAVNTAAIQDPGLIGKASREFGSSTVVISIEAKKRPDGTYECYTHNGRVRTGIDAAVWAVKAADLGAGEILLTSIDAEGTGKGFDTELTRKVAEAVSIPVIACGGAGAPEHVADAIKKGRADAVSCASLFHYHLLRTREEKHDFAAFDEGNLNFLRSGQGYSRVKDVSIPDLKAYLCGRGIECRVGREARCGA